MFFKIGVLKKLRNIQMKTPMLRSVGWSLLLLKLRALTPATLLKNRLHHTRFSVNIAKILRTASFIEQLWWVLLLATTY